jgi:phosphatidylglycerophosphate synthase
VSSLSQFWNGSHSAGGGPLTRAFSQRIGAILAFLGCRLSLSPNTLTTSGLVIASLAALLYTSPRTGSVFAALVLFQLAYGLDCADGQLARATGKSSRFGGWWDVAVDAINLLVLSFSLLYLFSVEGGAYLNISAYAGVLVLTVGRVLILITSTIARGGEGVEGRERDSRFFRIKQLLWFVIDTPTFLLFVCVFRFSLPFLELYCYLIGAAYFFNAFYLAKTKL